MRLPLPGRFRRTWRPRIKATNAAQACLVVLAQMASVSTKWPKPLLGA